MSYQRGVRPDYTVGTITLVSNSKNFTTVGASLKTATIGSGDTIMTADGRVLIISEITGQNTGVLAYPCPASAAGANLPLRIRFQPSSSGVQGAVRDLLERWGLTGNIDALAGLATAKDMLAYFTGAGTADLVKFEAWARAMLDGAAFTFPSGFSVKGTVTVPSEYNGRLIMLGGANAPDLALEYNTSTGNAGIYDRTNNVWRLQTTSDNVIAVGHIPHVTGADGNGWCRFTNSHSGSGAETGVGTIGLQATGLFYYMYSGANVCAWDITGRQTLGIIPGERITEGTINVNRVGHLVGDASDGWVRMSNSLTGSAVGGSIRLTASGTLSYTFDDVQKMYCNASGNMGVTGSLSKGSGTFLIDHPLDPENRDLAHGFVEAPEYVNIYRGETRLAEGRATVNLDEYFNMSVGTFSALNADITVSSLQNQDGFARLKPLKKMDGGILEIICEDEESTDLVSWMVTGRRKDNFVLYIDENCERETGRFITEREKEDFDEVSI